MVAPRQLALLGALLLLPAAVLLPGWFRSVPPVGADNRPAPQPVSELPTVRTARAEPAAAERRLRLTGTLRGGSEATLAARLGARVVRVQVREGDTVRRGQVLVEFDFRDARRQAEQARAGVGAAYAALEKARAGVGLKRGEVERRIRTAQRGVEQARLQLQKAEAGIALQEQATGADVVRAQAGVDAARSALARIRKGASATDRRQAALAVGEAERAVGVARRFRADQELLFQKGGIPRIQLDEAREAHQKALGALERARTQQAAVEEGAPAEEISAAEARVREAEGALAAARAAAGRQDVDAADRAASRGQVQSAEGLLRDAEASRGEIALLEADVRAAAAGLRQAQAAARLADQQVGEASLSAPLDGVVRAVRIHPGELAGPGQPLVEIVSAAGVYLEASAPSRLLLQLSPGLPVEVTAEARPEEVFPGSIRSVSRVAGPDGRSYPVQIRLTAPAGALRPGGFARAEVLSRPDADAVAVPLEAIQITGSQSYLWVVRERKAHRLSVVTRVQENGKAVVTGEVRPGEAVVLSPSPGLNHGAAVRVEEPQP